MSDEPNQLDALLDSTKKRVFKLEQFDYYASDEGEALSEFRKKGSVSRQLLNREIGEWNAKIRGLVARGVEFERVHVVNLPLTEYLQFEIESYRLSIEAGEKISLVSREQVMSIPGLNNSLRDFFLFDERRLLFINFEEINEYKVGSSFSMITTDESELVNKYSTLEKKLLSIAVPLDRFLVQHS